MNGPDEEKRNESHRGVEEIDLQSGESLGSPITEGSGVRPPSPEDEEGES